jgi:membrane associated rhomboid family serine protease
VWDDLRESPATLTLAALWVLIFAMMQMHQGAFQVTANPLTFGAIAVSTSHQFGDWTTAELASGQLWRAVTATFIHYSLLHLLLNLFGLVQLGLLIEDWYGSPQFLVIYLVIGGLGNLLAGFARPWFGAHTNVHCGGGSTVVFGLIGLCAVVGWRMKTKEGEKLCFQMLGFLVFNGLMGLVIPNLDNLAHLCGTLVGGSVGFAHKALLRNAERPSGRWAGLVGALVLVGCMGAQSKANRGELAGNLHRAIALESWQEAAATVDALDKLTMLYQMAFYRGVSAAPEENTLTLFFNQRPDNRGVRIPPRAQVDRELKAALARLEMGRDTVGNGSTARAFDRVRALARQALDRPPTRLKLQEFLTYMAELQPRARQELRAAQGQLEQSANRPRTR